MLEIAARYSEGDYRPDDLFNRFFTKVDGLNQPLALLHPDYDTVPPEQHFRLGKKIIRQSRMQIEEVFTADMRVDRPATKSNQSNDSKSAETYEQTLNLKDDCLPDLLEQYYAELGQNNLSVVDSGAGSGIALDEITQWSFVDGESSVGITLPHSACQKNAQHSANIVHANTLHIAPKNRFDVFFSILGTTFYHPFTYIDSTTPSQPYKNEMFAFLQALNYCKDGGLICDSGMYGCNGRSPTPSLKTLFQQGFLEPLADSTDFARNPKYPVRIARVKKHPTLPEIRGLLTISDKNEYEKPD